MNYTDRYYDEYIYIDYFNINEKKPGFNYKNENNNYFSHYKLLYCNGVCRIFENNKSFVFKEPIIFIAKKGENFNYRVETSKDVELLEIRIHRNVFSKMKDVDDFLAFLNDEKTENRIFRLKQPENLFLTQLVLFIKSGIFSRLGNAHMLTRTLSLFSELSFLHKQKTADYVASKESVEMQLIDFIENNFTDKITMNVLYDKFFISPPVVNSFLKKHYGKPFKEFLSDLRLENARNLILDKRTDYKSIAKLSGFRNYSAFYQLYLKKYGYSPSQTLKKEKVRFVSPDMDMVKPTPKKEPSK